MVSEKSKYHDIALSEVREFDGYDIFLRKDNIMQLQFKPGFTGELSDAKNMIKVFAELKGKERCLALVIYEDDNTFTKETREYIASDEVSKIVKADALIINGLALRIIGNGYLRINKPKRPTKLFNTPEAGLKWLKQFA